MKEGLLFALSRRAAEQDIGAGTPVTPQHSGMMPMFAFPLFFAIFYIYMVGSNYARVIKSHFCLPSLFFRQ
jgi:hypothetical protein